jgi:hypothetical protein
MALLLPQSSAYALCPVLRRRFTRCGRRYEPMGCNKALCLQSWNHALPKQTSLPKLVAKTRFRPRLISPKPCELLRGGRHSLFQPCIDAARGKRLLLSGTREIELEDMAIMVLDFDNSAHADRLADRVFASHTLVGKGP